MKKQFIVLAALCLSVPLLAQGPVDLINHALTDLAEAKRQLTPASVVTVPAGGNVQAAIDANPGATIALTGTYTGTLELRGRGGVLTSAGFVAGGAITPTLAAPLAKLKSPGQLQSAVLVAGDGWTLRGLEITGEANDLVNFQKGVRDFTVDRVYIHGDAALGAKRGIALNGINGLVTNSWIADIKRKGQDSQALGGWDGPGPYRIEHSYLQAAGENIMFGGADPTSPDLIPSDIAIVDNVFEKDPTWRGQGWTIKNILELKNARRVAITGNTMRHSWTDGQTGFAFMLTVRNQDGGCPWCTVEDVLIERNAISDVGAGFNILATDSEHPSQTAKRIAIRSNTLTICTTTFPGAGRLFQIDGNPQGLELTGNAFGICPGSYLGMFITVEKQIVGFVAKDNTFPEGQYGIHSPDAALGKPTLDKHAPGYDWQRNVVTRTVTGNNIPYPAGTTVQ